MIDWLVHLAIAGFAGGILAFGISIFKVGPGKPEFPFFKVLAACMLLTIGGPFGYVEYQTRQQKPTLFPVVKAYFNSERCPLEGSIENIKILHVTRNSAYAYLISKEKESWGGYEYPIMRLKLSKSVLKKNGKEQWSVVKGEVLQSSRLNKDNLVWPPYH